VNVLSAMTISVFDIQLLSLASHACLKQLVTYYLRAVRFALFSCDSCLSVIGLLRTCLFQSCSCILVIGLLRTCLFLIDIYSRACFIGLSTRKAMSHRVRHIVGYCLFFVCASSFVSSSNFYFSSASLAYFWNT
jgi:hypothetical protein